jgi:outer membrane receptor protein involved in Fe transport
MKSRWLSTLMVLALAVVGLTANVAIAQTTGDIDGTVSDTNNAPLPGASVTLTSPALQGTRTTVSDAAGRYRFPVVPSGTYTVTAAISGFTKAERRNIVVSIGATATVPITLSVSVREEVVVTGEAPVVDTTKTEIGGTISTETLQKLPLGRNFTAVAQNFAGTTVGVWNNNPVVYGATGLENQYIVDGVNTTGIKLGDQGKTVAQEFIQEIEVKTGGYEAEYSRALGGTFNVVTKSGGNEFHGDAFAYYDASSLAGSDKTAADKAAVGQGALVLPKRLDGGADLGGFLMKDRIWFFGAYDGVKRDQDINQRVGYSWATKQVTTIGSSTSDINNNYSGKLTFRLGESNTIAVSVFGDPETFKGRLTDIISDPATQNGTINYGGPDISAKWDGIFGTGFLAQLQYGHHEQKNDQQPDSTGLAIQTARSGYLTFYNPGSGNPLWYNEKYKRDAGTLTATGFFGGNEVKLGVNYEDIKSNFEEQYGGGDIVTDRYSASSGKYSYTRDRYFSQIPLNCVGRIDSTGKVIPGNFGQPGPGNALVPNVQACAGYTPAASVSNPPTTANTGAFLQDSWKIMRNLTLNLGVRYDDQKLKDADGNTSIHVSGEWSPRAGLVWDFMNNGKSKFTASYGRYYTVIPQDIQTRALGNEYTTFAYNYSQGVKNPVTNTNIASYAYVQGGELVQPGLKGMYQDELIGGVEYELFKNWSVGVRGVYKALGRAMEDRCDVYDPRLNLSGYVPAGALTTCSLVNLGDSNDPLQKVSDPSNPACWSGPNSTGTLAGNCETTHLRRYYRGVELNINHRFSNNFYMLANYVYSSLRGSFDGNEFQVNGQQDPNISAGFDYVDFAKNSFGRMALDRKNQFKISGMYSFPFGLSAGGDYHYSSGAPFVVHGYLRPGYYVEGFLLPDRGELGSMPAVWEADLHLEYSFRIGAVSITPIADIFNLLNRQGVTNIDGNFNGAQTLAANTPSNQIGNAAFPNCNASTANYGNSACSTNPNYLKAIAWQNPISVRLGARVSF